MMQLFNLMVLFLGQVSPAQMGAIEQRASEKPQEKQADIMIIEPSVRAHDYKEVYEYLKKEAPAKRIQITLKDHETLTDITDMNVMSGGTIIIFKTSTFKGVQYSIVNVEDIKSMEL